MGPFARPSNVQNGGFMNPPNLQATMTTARIVLIRAPRTVALGLGWLVLSACGGGGGSDGQAAAPAAPAAAAPASVPAAASASVQGLMDWASTLPRDDTGEPLATGTFNPPVDDSAEPMPIA